MNLPKPNLHPNPLLNPMILTYFKLQPHQLNIAVLHLPHTREILPSFLFYPTETHTGEWICPSSYSYWVVAWHHPAPSSAARLQITPPCSLDPCRTGHRPHYVMLTLLYGVAKKLFHLLNALRYLAAGHISKINHPLIKI